MSEASRDALISRIRKLQSMTIARGCSEAEAESAAAKVAALLAEHNVAMSELTLKADAQGCITDAYAEMATQFQDWSYCMTSIAYAFNCKTWLSRSREDTFDLGVACDFVEAKYFGFREDVAAAIALTAICANALATESTAYLRRHGGGRSAGTSFRRAMASRLGERIRELRTVPASTGRALVVLKDQLVQAQFRKLGLRLGSTLASEYSHNSHAASAGRAAADRVGLGQHSVGTQRRLSP